MAFSSYSQTHTPQTAPGQCTAASFEQLQVELSIEKALTARLLRELSVSQGRIQELQMNAKQLEAMASLQCLSEPVFGTLAGEEDTQCTALDLVGRYPASVRKAKIAKYKAKRLKYHKRVQVSRCFKGRSVTAQQKLREKGRFVKLPLIQ